MRYRHIAFVILLVEKAKFVRHAVTKLKTTLHHKKCQIDVMRLFHLDNMIVSIPSKVKLISIQDLHHTSSTSGNLSAYYLIV